jgi:nuclease HARBI1
VNNEYALFLVLAILLRRLVWSSRYDDLSREFSYDDSSISHHFNSLLLTLVDKYINLLSLWPRLTQQRIVEYEKAINTHSPAIRSIWCFLDGTLRRIARPVRHQRICHSGYKRTHGNTFQTLVAA